MRVFQYVLPVLALAASPAWAGEVDATEHKELASEFGIRGFPTIKMFKSGKPSDYNGGRTKDDIVSYVKKKSGPAATTLEKLDDVSEFEKKDKAVIVGLFNKADSDAAKLFLGVADGDDKHQYGISTDDKVRKEYGASKTDKILVLKEFDEKKAELDIAKDTTEEDVESFINIFSMPVITEFSAETSQAIFGGNVKNHLLIFADKEADGTESLMKEVTSLATKQREKIMHVLVPHTEERVMNYFGFEAEDLPKALITDMSGDMKKYFHDGDLSESALLAFQTSYFAGELKPTLKSEEPSDDDLAEPVKVVKGKSFNDMVINNDKDVLVEFYAPWCGHCKQLAPKYDELAEKLGDVDSVVIAKMDATANEVDHPSVAVKGFPTLLFFKGGEKDSAMKYEGAREVDDMAKFIMEKASTSFTLDGVASGDAHEEL